MKLLCLLVLPVIFGLIEAGPKRKFPLRNNATTSSAKSQPISNLYDIHGSPEHDILMRSLKSQKFRPLTDISDASKSRVMRRQRSFNGVGATSLSRAIKKQRSINDACWSSASLSSPISLNHLDLTTELSSFSLFSSELLENDEFVLIRVPEEDLSAVDKEPPSAIQVMDCAPEEDIAAVVAEPQQFDFDHINVAEEFDAAWMEAGGEFRMRIPRESLSTDIAAVQQESVSSLTIVENAGGELDMEPKGSLSPSMASIKNRDSDSCINIAEEYAAALMEAGRDCQLRIPKESPLIDLSRDSPMNAPGFATMMDAGQMEPTTHNWNPSGSIPQFNNPITAAECVSISTYQMEIIDADESNRIREIQEPMRMFADVGHVSMITNMAPANESITSLNMSDIDLLLSFIRLDGQPLFIRDDSTTLLVSNDLERSDAQDANRNSPL